MTYQAKCQNCGKPYDAKRKTSRYCSTKCRVAANRAEFPEGTIDREIYAILDGLELIAKLSDSELNNKRNKPLIRRMFQKIEELRQRTESFQESREQILVII